LGAGHGCGYLEEKVVVVVAAAVVVLMRGGKLAYGTHTFSTFYSQH